MTVDPDQSPFDDGDNTPAASSAGRKRTPILISSTALIVACAATWLAHETLRDPAFVSTKNAYTTAHIAIVTPRVPGTVDAVTVQNTDQVNAGDILVRLDPSDARIALAETEAKLTRAERRVEQLFAINAQNAARLKQAETAFAHAVEDVARARTILAKATEDTETEAARKAVLDAETRLFDAEIARALAAAESARSNAAVRGTTVQTNPLVRMAQARFYRAELAHDRLMIRAPIDGVVARRSVEIGQRVSPDERLMTIIPRDGLFVDAAFTQDKLENIRKGQKASLSSEIYGEDVIYTGRVAGIAAATDSAPAFLTDSNAGAARARPRQRLPVRIALDPGSTKDHPLAVGLAMTVTIHLDEDASSDEPPVSGATPARFRHQF